MSARACLLRLAAMLVLAGAPAQAQEIAAPPVLRARIDTTTITVGGRLHLTLTALHAPGAIVHWPDSLDLTPFEVLAAVAHPVSTDADGAVSSAVFTLTAFELGEFEIPAVPVRVESGGTVTELASDPFGVAVVSVGLDEGVGIRDIRGPLSIPGNPLLIALGLLAFMLAGAAGYWLVRRLRRDPPQEDAPPDAPARPAHELAREALDQLESSALLRRGRFKDYYIEVSDIMRRYLEGRYGIRALEMTTGEILELLTDTDAGRDPCSGFAAVFEECDLVKFAKHRPGPDACARIVPAARALVDATLPPPEPERDGEGREAAGEPEETRPPEEGKPPEAIPAGAGGAR